MPDWSDAALNVDTSTMCGHDVADEKQREAGAADIQTVALEQSRPRVSRDPGAVILHVDGDLGRGGIVTGSDVNRLAGESAMCRSHIAQGILIAWRGGASRV
jgi:hypothetical protein